MQEDSPSKKVEVSHDSGYPPYGCPLHSPHMAPTLDPAATAFIQSASTTALWLDRLAPFERRAALAGDTDVDVAIVGGGFSGLWTAYYLIRADPTLRVMVIEKDFCGFGASGRNGGWAVGELASGPEKYAQLSSVDAANRLDRAVQDAVDEIGRIADAEGIDCDYAKGGWIRLARNAPQADRQRQEMADGGHGELLDPDHARRYLNATNVRSGIYFPHCASIDPAKLTRGLADRVEAAGVTIVEDTAVRSISPNLVTTDHGRVRADIVVQATEAYTRDLDGERRALLPVYSLMVATEPLPDALFDDIGLAERPTFSDDRFMVIYGQRTADNRLAFGGRGVPYLWGSAIRAEAETHGPSHALLRETLIEMLPMIKDAEFTHRWGGVLGIPRDWVPGLRFDQATGVGVLGGYVGEGVAAANLAGRTMAELALGQATDRTSLPWVGHRSRTWEPEPFRWLGVRSSRRILAAADDREEATDREAKVAYSISKFLKGA